MKIDLNYIPVLPELLYEMSGNETIVINPEIPAFFKTNETGRSILKSCDGRSTIGAISHRISQLYDEPPDLVTSHLFQFFQDISKSGLLDSHNGPWRVKDASLNFYFEVTRRCNAQCVYCYASIPNKKPDPMAGYQVMKVLDQLKDSGAESLIISGGEPMLRRDIFQILKKSSSLYPTILLTNGYKINKTYAEILSKIEGLHVRVSLDSSYEMVNDRTRGYGAFKLSIKGIKRMIDAGLASRLSINATICRSNFEYIFDLAEFSVKLGIPSLIITPLVKAGKAENVWNDLCLNQEELTAIYIDLEKIKEKFRNRLTVSGSIMASLEKSLMNKSKEVQCPLGYRPAIDPRGHVYPCSLMMTDEFRIGNILETPIEKLLESDEMKAQKTMVLERKEKIEECRDCPWGPYCFAGCPARAYLCNGSLFSKDPDCQTIKSIMNRLMENI